MANFDLILGERLEVKEQLSLAHGHTHAQLLLVTPPHSSKKHRINIAGRVDFWQAPLMKRRGRAPGADMPGRAVQVRTAAQLQTRAPSSA